MKFNKLLLIFTAVTSIFVTNLTSPVNAQTTNTQIREVTNAHNYTVQWTNNDFGDYYESIDFTSYSTLKTQLQSLNSTKRKKTVGYSNMWNYFDQTDYHPDNKSKYVAFYQGTAANKGDMNKEHVWPKSHGSGGRTDADIHMVRPTLSADNSSRGNSFYVEGMNHSSNGWDPKAAGMNEQYRGQAARIIFYCVIADSKLSLVDTNYSSTSNANPDYKMGKLSDLLKWNLEYTVDITELNRNSGAEDIQGNRNPFIDNPYLACAIWGNYNETTRQICADYNVIVDPYTGDITLPDYSGSSGSGDSGSSGSGTGTTTPTNYGTASSPLTIAEVKTICDGLSSGSYSAQKGYVTGVVKTEPTLNQHESYEFYLEGGNTEFMVYSAKLASGISVPKIGDTIVVNGYFKIHNGIYEVAYISALNDSPYIISVNASGTTTPDPTPTPNPDTPSGGGNSSTVTSEVSFNFLDAGIANTSYAKEKTVIIDGKNYYFSDIFVGDNNGTPVVRLGHKTASSAINDLGLSGNGSYLRPEFNVENCVSMLLEIKATYSGTEGYKILFQEANSSTYTTVKEGTLSGPTTLQASLTTPKTGKFIIVITGAKARADLGEFTISSASNSSGSGSTDTPSTTVDLSSINLNASCTSTTEKSYIKFAAEIDKTKLSSATKVGILVFSKNQLGTKEIKQLYTSGDLSSFKSSISKYDYLDFDFTSSKVESNDKTYFTAVITNAKGHEDYKFVAVAYAEINGKVYFTSQITKSYNDCK